VPSHLLVWADAYIGGEFGQMFRRFGAQVTISDVAPPLLSREDPDLIGAGGRVSARRASASSSRKAEQVSGQAGPHRPPSRAEKSYAGRTSWSPPVAAAQHRELGCDAGHRARQEGSSSSRTTSNRTSSPWTYAVGDVIGGPVHAHLLDAHRTNLGSLRVRWWGHAGRGRQRGHIPYTAFTDPQVAGVGLSGAKRRERGSLTSGDHALRESRVP